MIKMCEKHWKKCQKAVKAKGLGHLISNDIDELTDRITDTQNERDYEPLFHLSFMITIHAIECGGEYLSSDNEIFCPLCEAIEKTEKEDMDDNWIEGAMKEIYEKCVKLSIQG